MLHSTFVLSLLASTAIAQLSESSLKTHVGSLALSSSFNPIKESYWTGLPHHRRTPFAVSPDGKSAYLAYLDASGNGVHVQQVDPTTFAAVGTAVTVSGGKEAGGLVAHNDGFALLTNEALPSGTSNAPAASTPVAVLYRYTTGKTGPTFKTFLGGPDNVGGMGALASPDMNGDLAYSEASGMYGAYFVVTAYSGSAQGHFGDAIQYVNENGTLEKIQGASSYWGCSHNTGIAFEAADSVPFASLCAEDQGAIWLNTGTSGMDKSGVKVSNENVQNGASNEPMGGMGGSYSGLARFINSDSYIFTWVSRGAKDLTANEWMGNGYTKSVNRTVNRNVAIATFSDKKTLVGEQATSVLGGDGDKQVNWITQGTADAQNAHVAVFDGSSALVSWEEIANPTCEFIAMGCKGAFTGAYYQLVTDGKKVGKPVKSMNVYVAGDQVTMADGRICWPYVDMDWKLDGPVRSPASVKAISFACMSNGAGSGASAVSSAPAASKTPVSASTAGPVSSPVAKSTGVPIAVPTSRAALSTVAPAAPAEPTLPTFEFVSLGATIDPVTTQAPATSSVSLRFDDDQPAPYESVYIPSSELFYASLAQAFTETIETPLASIAPVYPTSPTTPCSTEVKVTDQPAAPPASFSEFFSVSIPTELATKTPAGSEAPIPTTPCSEGALTPTEVPAGGVGTPDSPVPTPSNKTPAGEELPFPENEPEATGAASTTELPPFPTGTGLPSYPSGASPVGSARPPFPTGGYGNHHGHRPSHGWGRPRPSGFSRKPRPTRSAGRPRPSASFSPEKYDFGLGQGQVSSKPCTLKTSVRPTPTARVR
ncbi:hypothetical protein ACN47E_003665 [Coniothyrium glycines]